MVNVLLKDIPSLGKQINWEAERRLKAGTADDEQISINVGNLKDTDIKKMYDLLVRNKYNGTVVDRVGNWLTSLKNPKNTPIKSVTQLKEVLIAAIKAISPHWILMRNRDGMLLPYAVDNISYTPQSRYNEEHTTLELKYIGIESPDYYDDDDEPEIKEMGKNVTFYPSDLYEREFGKDSSESFVDLSEDEDFIQKKTPSKKRNYLNLINILENSGVMLMTKEALEQQHKDFEMFMQVKSMIGKVFDGDGMGKLAEDRSGFRKNDRYRSYSKWGEINEDDVKSRLVVDVIKIDSLSETTESSIFGVEIDIPTHPYIHTYNLNKYIYVDVHVRNLKPHVFDKNIIDKLILSDSKKKLFKALVSDSNKYKDLIEGKSGGTIILATGGEYGVKITDAAISEIVRTYEPMSGRDIKNTLKMIVKYNKDVKNVTFSMIEKVEEFIHFLNRKTPKKTR